jgi:hypothetical protein
MYRRSWVIVGSSCGGASTARTRKIDAPGGVFVVVKGVAVGGSDRRIRGRRRLLTRRPESAGQLVQGEASISRWLVKKYLLRGFAIFDASETGLLS